MIVFIHTDVCINVVTYIHILHCIHMCVCSLKGVPYMHTCLLVNLKKLNGKGIWYAFGVYMQRSLFDRVAPPLQERIPYPFERKRKIIDSHTWEGNPFTMGTQNHEIWRLYTPNIWVITPKNKGLGFPFSLFSIQIRHEVVLREVRHWSIDFRVASAGWGPFATHISPLKCWTYTSSWYPGLYQHIFPVRRYMYIYI